MTPVGIAGVLLVAGTALFGGAVGATADTTRPESDPVADAADVVDTAVTAGDSGAPGAVAPEWMQIVPGGGCECADTSEFSFWEREADPTKVVFFLQGGGRASTRRRARSPTGPTG